MKKIHLAIATHDIEATVIDYSDRLGCQPCVVVPSEYALWRTETLNLSVRQDPSCQPGELRHLGWEDPGATEFSQSEDVNGLIWENFSAEHQATEIDALWPESGYSLNPFSERSDLYSLARPGYPDELFAYLASLCETRKMAWDCATGSGQSAMGLARYFERVEATDISAEQIKYAVSHDAIHYSVQAAEKTQFADGTFDLIAVAQALHWFKLETFWPEVQRVLKPGGIFAAWAYDWAKVSNEVDASICYHLLEKIEPYWAPQNELIWEGYETIIFPMALLPPQQFSIEVNWTLEQLFSYMLTWSAMKTCMAQEGDAFVESAKTKVGEAWGEPKEPKKISFKLYLKVGRYTP